MWRRLYRARPKGHEGPKLLWNFLEQEEFAVAVIEGPPDVAWERVTRLARQGGCNITEVEFLTSELGPRS